MSTPNPRAVVCQRLIPRRRPRPRTGGSVMISTRHPRVHLIRTKGADDQSAIAEASAIACRPRPVLWRCQERALTRKRRSRTATPERAEPQPKASRRRPNRLGIRSTRASEDGGSPRRPARRRRHLGIRMDAALTGHVPQGRRQQVRDRAAVIRACREIRSHRRRLSEADRDSLHVRLADESVCIGPPPPSQSYLHVARLVSAAEVTGSDAIHPGYGFLSENAHFAEVCASCNFTFIGPTPEMIRRMGDKAEARRTMVAADCRSCPQRGHAHGSDEALSARQGSVPGHHQPRRRRRRGMRVAWTRGTRTGFASRSGPGCPQRPSPREDIPAAHRVQLFGDRHGT